MKKIAVLVSGAGTNLQALIKGEKEKKIRNGKITLVISSNEKAKAIEIAKEANIKTITIQKKDFNSNDEYQNELLSQLKQEMPDLIVLAGFLQIISNEIIQFFKRPLLCKASIISSILFSNSIIYTNRLS